MVRLAHEPRLGISHRAMGRVGALLPATIHTRIAGIVVRRRPRLVDRSKALVTGPRLEQGAVDREVLVREQLVLVGQAEHLLKEGPA